MRYVIEAGTDASSLLLFDPGALPQDFERSFQTGSGEILERLDREGRVCWITVDGDGGYSLHAYIGERVPRELERCAVEPETIDEFHVPTGRLIFAGSEYAFREDDSFLRNHPHMGSSFLVPPGVYRLKVFRTQYPKRFVEQLFRNQASPWEYCLWNSMILLIPLAVAAWIGLVVIFFTTVHVPFRGSWPRCSCWFSLYRLWSATSRPTARRRNDSPASSGNTRRGCAARTCQTRPSCIRALSMDSPKIFQPIVTERSHDPHILSIR